MRGYYIELLRSEGVEALVGLRGDGEVVAGLGVSDDGVGAHLSEFGLFGVHESCFILNDQNALLLQK